VQRVTGAVRKGSGFSNSSSTFAIKYKSIKLDVCVHAVAQLYPPRL